MGGDHRPGAPGPRQRDAGSSTSTARASTGSSPSMKVKQLMAVLRRRRLARRRGEVRPPAAGGLRPARRRRAAAPTSTPCRTRSTSPCSPTAAPTCATASSPAPTPTSARSSPTSPTTSWRPLVQNLGGHDLGRAARRLPGVRRGHRPPERRVRLHREGLGAADRRRSAEPRRAARRPSRSTPCAPRSGLTVGDRVGPLRPGLGRRPAVRVDRAAS